VKPPLVLVMGVAGAGKSTLGAALASALGWAFIEADSFHEPAAKALMAQGSALSDAERDPWIGRLAAACAARDRAAILACSALRARHRDRLAADLVIHLTLTEDEARKRLATRQGHFAGPALAASQFTALEPPADGPTVRTLDATREFQHLIDAGLEFIRSASRPS
jgi:gluconokinase